MTELTSPTLTTVAAEIIAGIELKFSGYFLSGPILADRRPDHCRRHYDHRMFCIQWIVVIYNMHIIIIYRLFITEILCGLCSLLNLLGYRSNNLGYRRQVIYHILDWLFLA